MGLTLAVARAGAFVAFCPFIPRSIPAAGAEPRSPSRSVCSSPPRCATPNDLQTADLFVNIDHQRDRSVRLVGWFLGTPIHLFQVAGSVIDTTSGITLGSVFDPEIGCHPRADRPGLHASPRQTLVIADGWPHDRHPDPVGHRPGSSLSTAGMGSIVGDRRRSPSIRLSELFRRGVELRSRSPSVLFVGELAFGLLGRMVPQINMFLVGLPLKTLLTLSMLGYRVGAVPAVRRPVDLLGDRHARSDCWGVIRGQA